MIKSSLPARAGFRRALCTSLAMSLAAAAMTYGAAGSFASEARAAAYSLPPPAPSATPDENLATLQKVSRGVADLSKDVSKGIVFVSVYKNAQGMPSGMIDPFEFFFGPGNQFGNPGQQGEGPQGQDPRGQDPRGRRGPRGQQGQEGDRPQRREGGLGSGFIVDLKQGYVITNNHVVQGADEIELKLANGETYPGKIIGRDPNTDVAVVQIKDKDFKREGLTQLALGNSDESKVGDFVLAIGAPFGLEASLSFGVISATSRGSLDITRLGNFIQTDAAINPGNSGGPLVAMNGQVIGMNTAIYSRTGAYNGIGFSVPANLVRTVAEQLASEGKMSRGYLGVFLQPLDEELRAGLSLPKGTKTGALVARVSEGSPAAKAGIEAGDVIVAVNGQEMRESGAIVNSIGLMRPGTKVDLKVYHDGKDRVASVTIGQHPDDEEAGSKVSEEEQPARAGSFGLAVNALTPQLRQRFNIESKSGALITDVQQGSSAERAGLRPGDVVLKVDGKRVDSADQFRSAVKGKKRVLVYIERSGEYYFQNLKEQ